MVTTRTTLEIDSELLTIRNLYQTVPERSAFGDDNHAAIRAQIQVLQRRFTEDEVQDRYEEEGDYVLAAAMTAQSWLNLFEDSLSSDWKCLVPARKRANKRRTAAKPVEVEQRAFDAHMTEAGRIHARGLGLILD